MSRGRINSMTGFGYGETQNERLHVLIEIKSYNNRYLDIIVSSSPVISPLEPRIRELIASKTARGRVEAVVKVRELEENIDLKIDKTALASYMAAYSDLIRESGIDDSVKLSHLIGSEEILKKIKHRQVESLWQAIEPLFREVLESFGESRQREGDALRADMVNQIGRFEAALEIIEGLASRMATSIREMLEQKLKTLFANPGDEARILTETALLLVKYSVNEEIVRTRGHLKELRTYLDSPGAAEAAAESGGHGLGKKLDFICQELNREINTMASKSTILEINQAVIEMKDTLENIREQLRNVE
ncbi:MAG: YicC family protein [Spirochaetales bacterium]|nr:MAG: YicC family protein [Spirochaetales bacterium]